MGSINSHEVKPVNSMKIPSKHGFTVFSESKKKMMHWHCFIRNYSELKWKNFPCKDTVTIRYTETSETVSCDKLVYMGWKQLKSSRSKHSGAKVNKVISLEPGHLPGFTTMDSSSSNWHHSAETKRPLRYTKKGNEQIDLNPNNLI